MLGVAKASTRSMRRALCRKPSRGHADDFDRFMAEMPCGGSNSLSKG